MKARLYRIHAWLPSAPAGTPGHPLYLSPKQGSGRVDNPLHYKVLYLAETPAGAVAETFGGNATWTDSMLDGPPYVPGSVRALSSYDVDAPIVDLDNAKELLDRGLKPSRVLTRHRTLTRAWALGIFREGTAHGVRWWSYYEPDWASLGMWDVSAVSLVDTTKLTRAHAAVTEATAIMNRPWA